ncbi:MAG TPA: response regulator [Candidatus Binatia bacterium]|jgi:CheY-like chemotaxis protein|nr:response regulator [Candidatus Binatia bacterium]
MPAYTTRKRILIVDDDPDVLEVHAALLEAAGYEVARAEHSLAALFEIIRKAPDLILADLRMPIMDGLALVRELKARPETRHIQVVALTGYDTPESRAASQEAGCAGYLTKPIDARHFAEEVARFLQPPDSLPAIFKPLSRQGFAAGPGAPAQR